MGFANLTDLDLYGGHYYNDKICELLQIRGDRIVKLRLISVQGIDYKALALFSIHCPKMKSLTFNKCDLVEYKPRGDINSDQEYERREAYIAMVREAHEIVSEFHFLEDITISTPVSSHYLLFLLSRAPELKTIDIGPKSDINDEIVNKILKLNPLKQLEEFHCEKSDKLSLLTFDLLVNNCENLKAIGDLQKWMEVEPAEFCKLREMLHRENYDLDISSNQRLRKYLDLREFERRTYINLVAGPMLERLKMAERQYNAL